MEREARLYAEEQVQAANTQIATLQDTVGGGVPFPLQVLVFACLQHMLKTGEIGKGFSWLCSLSEEVFSSLTNPHLLFSTPTGRCATCSW